MKIALVGGAGGHLRELMQISNLLESKGIEFFFVTIDTPFTRRMKNTYLVRFIGIDFPRLLVLNILNVFFAIRVIARESPDMVITTGPEFAIPYCIFGKIRKSARIIYIESLCRIRGPSGTGRIIGPFVDSYLVQWEEALETSPRKARFWGRLI